MNDKVEELRQQATAGDVEAQYQLGLKLDNGAAPTGEPPPVSPAEPAEPAGRQPVEAAYWYRLAAEQGHAAAQLHLGLMYDTGDGVEKDEAVAAEWYRQAAGQGIVDAQVNLGLMYVNGTGVARNDSAAVQCFRLAAAAGHPQAQFNLGAMLYNGVAGEPDLGEVYQWWTLAAMQGHPSAQQNLEIITGKLSRQQITEVQATVAEFMHGQSGQE
ncbi:MAG: tetratricopeptide repeat protein [Gammaproteobacteria bacterium]